MATLFVYGTLCYPEIVEKLTGKTFNLERAVLKGFQRRRVKNDDYPAIIKNNNSEVDGMLIYDVDERSMNIFSLYEGEEYTCKELILIVNDKLVKASVFVWNSDVNGLENFDWDPEVFMKNSFRIYVEKVIPDTILEFSQK